MAALADNVGLLFRIKADSSDAIKEIAATKLGIAGLAKEATATGGAMGAMAVPATVAVAAVAALGVAAVAAGVGLVKLAFEASDLGSKLQDAAQKTGVGIESIQAFGFAATQAGVSIDKVEGSLSKFSVLLGQAELGNKKAQETLAKFGITATDVDSALGQAVANISAMASENEKAAASATLFKDRTGAAIAVIREMQGDLPGAIAKLKAMGAMMSDENVKAADELGDAWSALTAQIKVGAAKFALEYAPQIKNAITSIGQFVAENKEAWETWGRGVSNAVTGAIAVINTLGTAANNILTGVTLGLSNQVGAWNIWATAARGALMFVTAGASELVYLLSEIGRLINANQPGLVGGPLNGDQVKGGLGGTFGTAATSAGGGSRGGGRGGGGAGKAATDPNRQAIQDIQTANSQALSAYQALLDAQESELKQSLNLRLIDEVKYAKAVAELQLKALLFEQAQNATLLKDERLNDEERTDAENKKLILIRKVAKARIDIANDVFETIKKITEKEIKDFEEKEERRRKAERETANQRAKLELSQSEKEQIRQANDANLSILGDSVLSIRNEAGNLENTFTPMLSVFQMMGSMVQSLAQGFGSLVQQMVLTGTAGPNALKKLVASVLAGVAAQAAVLAIMELAYGIAALTPWGRAIYGDPIKHFKAAALFGSVAVATGLAGRGIAGDSFSQQTAGGGAGGAGGDGAGQPEKLNFTERFNGFMQRSNDQMAAVMQRTNEVLGGVVDAVDTFNQKFGVASPTDVVMAGAGGAGAEIFGAVNDHLGSDLRASSDLARSQGLMRS